MSTNHKSIEILEWLGLNSQTSKASLPLGFMTDIRNIDLSIPGVARVTSGYAKFTASQMGANVDKIFDFYRPTDSTHYFLIWLSGTGKLAKLSSGGVKTDLLTGLTTGSIADFVSFKNTCYLGDGTNENKATDGSAAGSRKWGITAPASAVTTGSGGAGALTGTYRYYVTYYNSATGHESNPNTTPASFTAAANIIALTNIPTSADGQVTRRRIYRTTSGGSIFFFLTEIADNATTTYNDNAADSTLSTREVPLDNDVPEKFKFLEEWDGRIWGVPAASTTELHFSNDRYLTPSGSGLPEESFSQDNRAYLFKDVQGIKKSPNFNELWVHLQGGQIYAIRPTGDPDDPYVAQIRNSQFSSVAHSSIVNIFNEQWFIDDQARVISIDSSGRARYSSRNVEPHLTGSRGETGVNYARLKYVQAVHYKKGTKNQYRIFLAESGSTNFNRLWCANYLQLTTDKSSPVWEKHHITGTSIGVVKDTNGQDVLYTGDANQYVQQQDTGTTFDGTAIDWLFSIGWMRTSKTPDKADILRAVKGYYNPLGTYNISMRTDFDFGMAGGQIYSIATVQVGDRLDTTFILDQSLLGTDGLRVFNQDVTGDYNDYVEITFFGSALSQVFELHNLVLVVIAAEGYRRYTSA